MCKIFAASAKCSFTKLTSFHLWTFWGPVSSIQVHAHSCHFTPLLIYTHRGYTFSTGSQHSSVSLKSYFCANADLDSAYVHVQPDSYFHLPPGPDCNVDAAAHHITAMFSSWSSTPDKPVYHHYTTATDGVNAKVVFDMVIDQVIKENVSATQLL